MRRLTALAMALALSAGVAACDDGGGASRTTSTSSVRIDRSTIAPIVYGSGAADIGIKWNWNLTPPLGYAEGIGWGDTFLEVEWCAVRDLDPGRRFATLERLLKRSTDMGYRMMVKIRVGACHGGPETLDPAEGTRKRPSAAPDDPAAYQEFVRNLVTRYSQMGVRTWAIENEVDANNFWSGSPQDYVATVKLAAQAIRQADPSATILDCGISSTGYGVAMAGELLDAGKAQEALALYQAYYERRHDSGVSRFPVIDSVEALRGLLQEGRATRVRQMVAANFEAVNTAGVSAYQLHFYENPDLLPTLLDYVNRHVSVPVPVQAWEIGSAWPGSTYNEPAHAAETAHLLGMLFAARISPVVYLPLAFTPGPNKTEVFRGLVSPDGTELPPGEVFRRFAAAAKDSVSIVPLSAGGGGGVLFVSATSSFAALWPAAGAGFTIGAAPGVAVVSAATPTVEVSPGATVSGPVLVDLDANDQAAAIADLSKVVGQDVSARR